jgi:hypothetical protein
LLGRTAGGGCLHLVIAGSQGTAGAHVHYFFGECEDAGLAGDDEEAVGRIASGPAGPLQAAGVDGAVEAVPGQGIGDKSSNSFHFGLLNNANRRGGKTFRSRGLPKNLLQVPQGLKPTPSPPDGTTKVVPFPNGIVVGI